MKKITWSIIVCMLFVMLFGLGAVNAKKSIEYISMWNKGEPHAAYMSQVADQFEKETGVKVNITFAGRDVLNKIKARLLMGNPPDLVDQDFNELTAALLSQEQILATPLNDFYKDEGPDGQSTVMDVFPDNLVNLYEKDGNLYFLPYLYVTSGFFYDKSMFKKYSLTPPKTWAEFIKNNETLKENGIAPLALDGTIQFYNAYYYYWAVNRVLGSDAFSKAAHDKTGKAWDDPGYLKAAQMVYELSKAQEDFFQKGYEGSSYPAAQADWARGESGSVLCGTWIPNETRKIVDENFEFGFYPFPEVKGGKGKITDVEDYLIGFAIPKGAKNPVDAKKFMKLVLKKENAIKHVKMTQNMSPRPDVQYPELLKDVNPVMEAAKSYHKTYDGLLAELPEWWSKIFYPLDNKLIFGTMTPENFIKQIKADTINYWNK